VAHHRFGPGRECEIEILYQKPRDATIPWRFEAAAGAVHECTGQARRITSEDDQFDGQSAAQDRDLAYGTGSGISGDAVTVTIAAFTSPGCMRVRWRTSRLFQINAQVPSGIFQRAI